MKASAKLFTTFSVTGLSLAFTLGCVLHVQAQQPSENTGGSFIAPQSTSATPVADSNQRSADSPPNASQQALLQARRALAAGQTDKAKSLVESARNFPIDNTVTSDTPVKVEAMIARHTDLVEMYQSGDNAAYNYEDYPSNN